MQTDRFTEIDQLVNGTSSDKVLEIRSVFKDGKLTVQPAWDSRTGWWAGVERLSDEQKKNKTYFVTVGERKEDAHLNTKIVLKHGHIFDLNNEVDRINWEWVKYNPFMAMSFDEAQRSKALFYVHIEGREAAASLSRREQRFEAEKLVMEDSSVNLVNRALLLGLDMSGENPATIKDFLMETAEQNPGKILHIYRDKSMKINLLYALAKQKGLISEDLHEGIVKYGVTILGNSPESAVAFLQSNEDLLMLLEREVKPEYFVEKQEKRNPADNLAAARAAKAEGTKD